MKQPWSSHWPQNTHRGCWWTVSCYRSLRKLHNYVDHKVMRECYHWSQKARSCTILDGLEKRLRKGDGCLSRTQEIKHTDVSLSIGAKWLSQTQQNKHVLASLDTRVNVESGRATSSPIWQEKSLPWKIMRAFSRAKEAVIPPFLLRTDCALIIYVQNTSCLLQQLILLRKN